MNIRRTLVWVAVIQASLLAGCVGVVHASTRAPSLDVGVAAVGRAALGNAIVPVTLTCTAPRDAIRPFGQIYISVVQSPGTSREATSQTYRSDFACNGKADRKPVVLTPWTVPGFGKGRVTVTIDAAACWWVEGESQSQCVNQNVSAVVRLHRSASMPPATSGGTFPVSINRVGHVHHGVAKVRIGYRCSAPSVADIIEGEITVMLRQQLSRTRSSQGYGSFRDLTCDGTFQRARVSVSSDVPFGPRRTTAHIDAWSHWYDLETDDEYWTDGFVDAAVVTLRRA